MGGLLKNGGDEYIITLYTHFKQMFVFVLVLETISRNKSSFW